MVQPSHRIVVIGAGYAGLLATVRLAGKVKRQIQRGDVTITLINAADVFVERVRLHQIAANRAAPQRPIAGILRGTGVSFVCGLVTRIDTAGHTLEVETGATVQQIHYDNLLYALGSTIDRDGVPGVREHAYVLTPTGQHSVAVLRELLPRLNTDNQGGRLLVCGGGATGIEAAAEFAESFANLRVQLVTQGEFGAFTRKDVADYMRQSLIQMGVTIQEWTTITELRASEALTTSGALLPYEVCLWAGGFSVPPLARETGLAVNERGQILIDPFMRSISHSDVWAVGDAAYPVEVPGSVVRMSAFTAVLMGAHGADCLSAALQGQSPRPFSFVYAGQGIALGRRRAIGFGLTPDDRPKQPYFTGRVGYELRESFVRLLANLPNLERRRPGFFVWLGKGRYAASRQQGGITASTPAPITQPDPGK